MKVEIALFKKLRNLGKASVEMLEAAGIHSESELRSTGSVAAYVAVKNAGRTPSLNLLWVLEGALTHRDWEAVTRDDRRSLLIQLDDYERKNK